MKYRKGKIFLTAAAAAIIISMTGCGDSRQTTEQLVTEKETAQVQTSDEKESEAVTENADGIVIQVKAPERYEADFQKDGVSVHADAQVIVPQAAGFKLYKVTGRNFEQEDYDVVSSVLLNSAPLWERNGFSKSEIEEKIQRLEEQAAQAGSAQQQSAAQAGSAQQSEKQEMYEDSIAQWNAMLEEAPQEVPSNVIDATVPHEQSDNVMEGLPQNELSGYVTVDGEDYLVMLDNYFEDDWLWVEFLIRHNERYLGSNYVTLDEEDEPEELSKDAIREEAAKLVNEMGFTDFALAGEEYFQKYGEDGALGYGIHFTRVLDGIPVTYTHEYGGTVGEDGEAAWVYEAVTMVFDEEGFTDFIWWNPYTVEKQSDEYVFLMPFSDIQDIFEEMIVKKYDWMAESGDDITVSFTIDEVRLGYMRVRDDAGAKEGVMIPVWDFMGSREITYGDTGESFHTEGPYESWLTINAMDGTIIDRGLGY